MTDPIQENIQPTRSYFTLVNGQLISNPYLASGNSMTRIEIFVDETVVLK
jgi:hypothetical protein